MRNRACGGLRGVLVGSALLALGYFVIAWLSLAIAVPPGYASPIWPAAGVSLAVLLLRGRGLWPGVWIGSLVVNIVNAWPAADAVGTVVLASVAIATGATLQALLAATLVRRLAPGYRHLEYDRDILRFLAVGGPVACLVSATVGVCALYGMAIIDAGSVTQNWLTWWAGDSLGTVIAAPLCMLLSAPEDNGWRSRRAMVVLPVSVMAAMVIATSLRASQLEVERLNSKFSHAAEGLGHAIGEQIDAHLGALEALGRLLAGGRVVSGGEFEQLASRLLPRPARAQTLSWAQLVPARERARVEGELGATRPGGLRITERAMDGRLVDAEQRERYVVERYVTPSGGNELSVGYDAYSSPLRAAALDRAVDSGAATATPLVRLPGASDEETGIVVYLPIYSADSPPATVIERRSSLTGFVALKLHVDDLVRAAHESVAAPGIGLRIEDHSALSGATLLYEDIEATEHRGSYVLARQHRVDVAGRQWLLRFSASQDFLAANEDWQAGVVMLGGLFITGLLEAFLLIFSARADAVSRLVAERTSALTSANRQLEREVAERERAETSLLREKEAAEAASLAKGEFLSNMSHEIRTPLNAILGLTELGLAARPDAEQRANLEMVRDAGRSLLEIVNEVLDFARIESGRLTLEQVAFDPRELVHATCRLLRGGAQAKGLVLDEHVAVEVPALLLGDPLALRQILVNLVGNAIKFTAAGSVVVTLRERARGAATSDLELEVNDTGIGIPADRREAIFEAFCQADNSTTRSHGGTGLGLTICARLAAAMGGDITVESRRGAGSRFICRLSLGMGEAPAAPTERLPVTAMEAVSLRVLLAEDNPVNQKVAARLLQKLGHEVSVVGDGHAAVAAVMAGSFDLVLMDLQMPGMDGIEALRAIRAWQAGRGLRTPVVALTAHAMNDVRKRCMEAGMDGYLAKPFDLDEFATLLARFQQASVA